MSGAVQPVGRQRWRRAAPIAAAAAVAFGAGALLGGRHVPEAERVAEAYAAAWEVGDLRQMYELTDRAGGRSLSEFARAHRDAEITATVTDVAFDDPRAQDGVAVLDARVETNAFGTVRAPLRLPVTELDGEPRIAWSPELAFPGLRAGETLTAATELPPRAALLYRDRTPLVRGAEAAGAPPTEVAASIAGSLGPIPADRADELRARGVPADALVGISGLERIFDDELRGRPGGVLAAGERTLASQPPRAAKPVRTTISPEVQAAALSALAGRFGGVIAMRPRSGEVLAAAGIPISGLQPPGSTFKIVTVVGGLEAGITRPSKTYPVQTETFLEGVPLENANGETCGGTLVQSFAHSCNTVFAPMGVQLGAQRLVEVAHRFGFDEPVGIPGAATPTLPPAEEIGDDLALGASAIGQGRVQATALTMTTIAATIANRGDRPQPTFEHGHRPPPVEVTSPEIADQVERMMEAVVREGTGTAAAIPGARVAGKTGTAELEADDDTPPVPGVVEPPDTDAWFVAYAPGGRRPPRVAVGVLLVRAGSGGDVAAPAARTVLAAAL